MSKKKNSVNITANNYQRIQSLRKETGMSQSEIINQAIAEVPIIVLGNQKSIAENFFEIKKLLAENNIANIKEEVNAICQSLSLLMQKQQEAMRLNGE